MIGVRVALLETSNDGMNINYKVLNTTFPERGKSIDDFFQFCINGVNLVSKTILV